MLLSSWPWADAAGHLIVLGVFGTICAELSLRGIQKIPFTCSYLPGKSTFHVAFWVFLLILFPIMLKLSAYELQALRGSDRLRGVDDRPHRYADVGALVDVAAGEVGGRAAAVRGGIAGSGRGAERVGRPAEPAEKGRTVRGRTSLDIPPSSLISGGPTV